MIFIYKLRLRSRRGNQVDPGDMRATLGLCGGVVVAGVVVGALAGRIANANANTHNGVHYTQQRQWQWPTATTTKENGVWRQYAGYKNKRIQLP
ncbi:hypothetical protein ACLKA7_007482 [Drosophila subpalustris]